MREPSGGKLASGALVRMMIQCRSSQDLAGKVNLPLKVAPACRATVSPQFALFRAPCRSPPDGTEIVLPGAGVLARVVCMNIRGNSAGPSELPVDDDTERVRLWELVLPLASVTLATNVKFPDELIVPLITPVELFRLIPPGSEPEAILQAYGTAPPAADRSAV